MSPYRPPRRLLPRRHDKTGVEVNAMRSRVTAAGLAAVDQLRRLTETTDARAPLAPCRHRPLDGIVWASAPCGALARAC